MTTPTTEPTTAKKTPEREQDEASPAPDAAAAAPPSPPRDDAGPRTKKSKKKKSKKRGRHEEGGGEDNDNANDNENDTDTGMDAGDAAPDKPSKEERRAARAAKKAQRADRPDVPTHDPAGVAYNKLQLRRMKRRVKHGLAPIASAEEEQELRAREKRERAEEERLYAAEEAEVVAVAAEPPAPEGDGASGDARAGAGAARDAVPNGEETSEAPARKRHNPPSKNTKRTKPVPEGYVCMACQNQSDAPPHWIYDCPRKVHKKGCNAVAKRLRGLHDPPSRKVFVGGLPFDCDDKSVTRFFEEGVKRLGDGEQETELVHLKLLKFEDSKRCKGQAFLTFASDEVAALALRMNGAVWTEAEEEAGERKKKQKKDKQGPAGEAGGEKKKELRLKVTKVLNRFVTKKQRGGHVMR